jgi:prepilin-type N-terminal cleavage/methylation domain-containing protein/prepilin-type processing-associated H-X9-DG protein
MHAFTLIELLVVVAIVAVLVAILLPALSQARESAKRVVCLSQLRQLGVAHLLYRDQHGQFVSRSGDWDAQMGSTPYWPHVWYTACPAGRLYFSLVGSAKIFFCPSNNEGRSDVTEYRPDFTAQPIWSTYAYCYDLEGAGVFSAPAPRHIDPQGTSGVLPLMMDFCCFTNYQFYVTNHVRSSALTISPEVSNVLFVDGHAEAMGPPTVAWWGWTTHEWLWAADVDRVVRNFQ